MQNYVIPKRSNSKYLNFPPNKRKLHVNDDIEAPRKQLKLDKSNFTQIPLDIKPYCKTTEESPNPKLKNPVVLRTNGSNGFTTVHNFGKYEYKVTEKYQIAFQIGDTDRIYMPNFIKPEDLTFKHRSNLPLNSKTVDKIWNQLTPLIISSDYAPEFKRIQEDGFKAMEDFLDTNIAATLEKERLLMIKFDKSLADLRKKMYKLLKFILREQSFHINFDPESIQLDRLIDHLIVAQSCCLARTNAEHDSFVQKLPDTKSIDPVVILNSNIVIYYEKLQEKCVHLIKLLLPRLQLPTKFDFSLDLNQLLSRICSVNDINA